MGEKNGNSPQETRIVKAIERSRIAVCFVAMFLGHSDYFRTFAALTVFSLAGLTAVESFFFGDVSARAQIKLCGASRPRPIMTSTPSTRITRCLLDVVTGEGREAAEPDALSG